MKHEPTSVNELQEMDSESSADSNAVLSATGIDNPVSLYFQTWALVLVAKPDPTKLTWTAANNPPQQHLLCRNLPQGWF